jgi:hypothetical protein
MLSIAQARYQLRRFGSKPVDLEGRGVSDRQYARRYGP